MIIRRNAALCILALATLDGRAQDVVDQLRATEHERLHAIVDADMEVARRLHADDFQLINPLGGALSKDEYLVMIASGEIDYLEWVPDEVEVKIGRLRHWRRARCSFSVRVFQVTSNTRSASVQ